METKDTLLPIVHIMLREIFWRASNAPELIFQFTMKMMS